MSDEKCSRVAKFLFEVGTLRTTMRSHRQVLMTSDLSDNIASHTFRVCVIGHFLANMEGVDAAKVMLMCLSHDMGETRSGDQNWVHKPYVTVDSARILRDQLEDLPFSDLHTIALEYELRESRESIVAKDADTIDQILLLREYAMQGNREAQLWLDGKTENRPYNYVKRLVTDSGKALGKAIYDESPSSWALKK